MKLLNLFTAESQVNNSRSGDCGRVKQAEAEALHTISGGRSMVEILGVLAIIGVLSVGGIVGYNTAMYKHRMNKTIQTFSTLLSNVIEVSNEKWEYASISERQGVLDYDLLTEEQCPVSARRSNGCKFPLGEVDVQLGHNQGGRHYLYGRISIYFYDGDIVKSCVDFLSQGWQNMYPPEWLNAGWYYGSYITVYGKQEKYLWALKSQQHTGPFSNAKKDITLSDIQTACDTCKGASSCSINMYINS